MKLLLSVLCLFSISMLFSQQAAVGSINLADIQLCQLTLADLKQQDKNLLEVDVIEMGLCSDGFVTESRFENRKAYSSQLYPGILFQTQQYQDNISKIRLTNEFKGFLPDGTYIDLNNLTAKMVLKNYPNLNTWKSKACSNYWSLTNKEIYFFVKINSDKEPRYPIDESYYLEQRVEGIDIVSDCNLANKPINAKNEPLYLLDGKEINAGVLAKLSPNDIESIHVLKDKNATDRYGEKGKNGVIEIFLKKK